MNYVGVGSAATVYLCPNNVLRPLGAVRPDDQGNENTARTDGRQNVHHIGRLLGLAHVGLADRRLANVDKVEFHCLHLSLWKVPVRRVSRLGGPA